VLETPVPSPEAPEYSGDDLPEDNDPNRSQQEPPPPLPVEREDSGYYGSREVSDSESSSNTEKVSINFSISDIETLEYPEDSEDLPTLHSKIPFLRELDTNPDEYTYIEGDTLNFKDKNFFIVGYLSKLNTKGSSCLPTTLKTAMQFRTQPLPDFY
jgi:hypothetical protein